jgi:transposase
VVVQPANVSEQEGAEQVLSETHDLCPEVRRVLVDQGYSGDDLADWCKQTLGITIEVVKKRPGQVGFEVLPKRWIVERTIAWLCRNRRLAKDFEHHPTNSAAMVYWASIQRMIRRLRPDPDREQPYARRPDRQSSNAT